MVRIPQQIGLRLRRLLHQRAFGLPTTAIERARGAPLPGLSCPARTAPTARQACVDIPAH